MSLLIVGSVAYDSIETPFGKVNKTLGGSASFFSLAASFFARPSIVAVVGEDFSAADKNILKNKKIDLSGLETAKGKTFHWGGKYSFDLNSRETLFTHLNVFENFNPKLSPAHQNSSFVFLGNIHPMLQLKVLSQVKKPKFVGLDTMNLWIEKTPAELKKVLKKVDVFIINDSEAREFSKQHNLLKAAKKIMGNMKKSATLIIKRGEYGLLMFKGGLIFHLPGFPLEDVVDPTGAGDSFAGGFMGFVAKTNNLSWENLKKACVAGSVLASFSVEKLGTAGLTKLNPSGIAKRTKEFKSLTDF
jgi:sugar/nucleoside kinase (ribokinase family)